MKITIITGPFLCLPPYTIGAVEKLWYGLGDYWRKDGHEVTYISKKPENAETKNINNIYVKGSERTGSWLKDFFIDFFYSFNALKAMPKTDVLILNTLWSPLMIRLFRRKYKLSVFSVERFPKKQIGIYDCLGGVDLFRCNSTAVYNEVIKQSPKSMQKVITVPNYIDTTIFNCKHEKRNIVTNEFIVSYAGRVNQEKGLHYIIKACNEIVLETGNKIRIQIIGACDKERGGSGKEYVQELNQLATTVKIDWVDPIYNATILAEKLKEADAFCYPSIAEYGETFGVAPLEAMGLGIPTIVSDLECFKDFASNGINVLIFNHRSKNPTDELKSKILELIQDDKLRKKISEEGFKTAQNFNAESISKQYEEIFEKYL